MLTALLAVAMTFTMMPLSGGQSYAETGSALVTQTPALAVTGKGLIGDGGVYSSSNVSNERSYTLDELKALGEGYVVLGQKYSAMKNSPFTKNYYLVDGVRVDALLGKTEGEITDDVYVEASDGYKVEFLQNGTYSNGKIKTVGIDKPRYFYSFTSAGSPDNYDKPEGERGEQVPAVIGWADTDTGLDGGENIPSALPEGSTKELGFLRLYVGQLGEESGGEGVRDRNQPLFNGKSASSQIRKVREGDVIDEIALTFGNKKYTRADILMMDFAEAAYTYQSSSAEVTDYVRGVPMSVLLAGYNDDDVVNFAAADGYDVAVSGYTVKQLIDNDYILAYEKGSSAADLTGIYDTAKKDASKFGFFRLYGADENGKPAKLINSISVTSGGSGIDFSTSPYKHITNGGQEGSSPYNLDSITGATLTVEGPGVKTSVPVSVRDLEGRDAGAARADYTDKREGSDVTRTYEGIDLYYILHNMSNGDNGIKLTDLAKKVLIKNRNRKTIAEFTLDQVDEAHNSGTPILVAYGTSLTDGTNVRPFVFNNGAGADSELGNEDGCIKLVYSKSSITGDINTKYETFGNMAYIYVAEADSPGYKHDKAPYQSPEISNYVLTVTGDKIGREVNYTVQDLENMVSYDGEGKPDNSSMGYRDEYSLANSNYWYVNEYEGVQLWKLLLKSGLDPALAEDSETIVSSTATDGYASTDKFTIEEVADPDKFGFYEKNPADLNDGTYEGNENIRQGDDVSTGDKLRTGYPVLVAYGVNGYPYVEKASQEGYLSGLQNDGGPLRIISGKRKYNHANGSNQAKLLDKVIVGDNTYHYSTHKYHEKDVYKALADTKLNVQILNGPEADASEIKNTDYTVGDIEKSIYEDLNRTQLKTAKVKAAYGQTKSGEVYSDLYEGINLSFFLTDIVEIPGYKGTITFSNGSEQITMGLEDVLKAQGGNSKTGIEGLYPVLAYAKNGAPLVASKNTEDGYESSVTLAEGTDYQNKVTIKNNGGPLQLIFPTIEGNADMSEKTITGINSIKINLAADKYAHIDSPYDTYRNDVITISGEGTRLTEAKDITVFELESKQNIAFTGDYSILKDSGTEASQTRYRGIDLYQLLTSSAIGLKTNADKVIITTTDGESIEFKLSDIRKKYMNTVTGASDLPVLLAYGTGIAGASDLEDGKPLVTDKKSDGYDDSYGNSGGPVRLVVGQTEAGDVNSSKNTKYVKSIEVTASEMTSWNHNASDVFKQYLSEKVNVQVTDKDGKELFNKDYTVEALEANTSLVERITAQTTQSNTWEGISFWAFIQQECKGITGIDDPVKIEVRANDGYTKNIRADFTLEELNNGIKDGTEYKPILLGYGVDGLPLTTGNPKQQTQFPNGEGYDATVGNNGGPIRLVTHGNQGASISCVTSIKITVGDGGSVEPEEPAAFTIKGLKSGDISMSVDDIKNLKNKSGDSVGQATGEYIRKGVTKTVKGALLKNILAAYGIENENAVITLNTPDAFETTEKGASYNNITLKQAVDQKYFLAYQEKDAETGEWKDIDDTVKGTDIHTNLRMYRYYCDATEGADSQNDWYDECTNITAITLDVPESTAFKEYPTSGGVRSTWMDKDGTIWVGTYGGGLYYKRAGDSSFSVINTASDPALKTDFTSAVAADAEGGIWVSQNASYTDPANNQGVLYIKDGEVTQYLAGSDPATIPNNYVQAIKADTDGKVWFGSFGGLTIYDPAAGTWTTYGKEDKNFPATSINTITLDGQGGAWLGFYPDGSGTAEDPYTGGFCHIDKDGNVDKVKSVTGEGDPMFAQIWTRSIAIDQKGTVWAVAAGTNLDDNVGGVVWKWQSSKVEPSRYTGKELFPDYLDGSNTTEVRTVAVDKEGSLWFGTSADGVLKVSNPKLNGDGTMNVDAQYAKETGSWSAANMNNVYSIDFWNEGTAYVGTSGGLMVLGDEPQGGGDEPAAEPAGDTTPEDAALTVTGDALARDGYFSIKGIKNADGIVRTDATFSWLNSSGTTGSSAVQGATLENIFNDVIGMKEGAEIDSVDIYSSDGRKTSYTAEQVLTADREGNKAMFIWTEDTAKVQKVIVGQFAETDVNKSLWAKDVNRIVVNAKSGGGDEPAVTPEEVAGEIGDLPKEVSTADKEAIEKARADYESLTEEQKAALPAGTVEKLEAAEARLMAAEVSEKASAVAALAKSVVAASAGGYASSEYTAASYSAYEKALTGAQAVMGDPNASADDIKAAMTALEAAKSGLVKKSANTMKVTARKKTVKKSKVKKAKKTVTAIRVENAVGTVSFAKAGGSKKLKVNPATGKITVKKKTKKGTYKIRVTVTASGSDDYLPLTEEVTVKVRVK